MLVLISSGAVAVAIMKWQQRHHVLRYGAIAAIFLYTTFVNMVERPEGLKIASIFIATIICTSLISRVPDRPSFACAASSQTQRPSHFIDAAARFGVIRIIANRPDKGDRAEYEHKLSEARDSHHLAPNEPVLFLEVRPGDASEFSEVLRVEGAEVEGFRVLRCQSPAIPNAIAALLLYLRDTTSLIPHAYFGWTEGNPIAYLLKFLVFGEGDTAPVTREVLRQTEDDPHAQAENSRRVTTRTQTHETRNRRHETDFRRRRRTRRTRRLRRTYVRLVRSKARWLALRTRTRKLRYPTLDGSTCYGVEIAKA